jgi:hypothetical protein
MDGSWTTLNNQPTAQILSCEYGQCFPYKVYGGQQDNTSVIIASKNKFRRYNRKKLVLWPGCESAFLEFDPNNPTKVYGGCYQGYIEVLDVKTRESKDIQAYPSTESCNSTEVYEIPV